MVAWAEEVTVTGTTGEHRPSAHRARRPGPESLADLLGGRRGAVDATLPPVAFAVGWLLGGESLVGRGRRGAGRRRGGGRGDGCAAATGRGRC